MAASFAKSVNCKHLVLTHVSQRYRATNEVEDETSPGVGCILNLSLKIFKSLVEYLT